MLLAAHPSDHWRAVTGAQHMARSTLVTGAQHTGHWCAAHWHWCAAHWSLARSALVTGAQHTGHWRAAHWSLARSALVTGAQHTGHCLLIRLQRGTGTDEIPVAVDVVDA